jgi:uncharacterized protein YdhG (YjbR/CyaY superfamily)
LAFNELSAGADIHMKKRAAGGGAAPKTVDEYLAKVPEPARGTLKKLRATIHSVVPAETTEVISYGMPAFKYKGMLAYYAAFAKHCSLFPTAFVIDKFKTELKGFRTSKGTVQFTPAKPLPIPLIKKIVKAAIARNESKARK